MGHSEKETGVIISIDDSLDDLVKGFIKTDAGEVIPFYHPNCVRFYIKSGQKVKFSVDYIGGFIVIPPKTLTPFPNELPPVEYMKSTFSLLTDNINQEVRGNFKSLIDELKHDEGDENQTQLLAVVVKLEGMVANSSTVYSTAKRKVAVDLEPRG